MTIICYLNKLYGGGAERVISVLASELARRGHQVQVVTDYASDNDFSLDVGVKRIALGGTFNGVTRKQRISRTVDRIVKLRRLCKKSSADVLISFKEEANFRALLATRFLKTKNLISVRTDPKCFIKKKTKTVGAKLLYPLADGCVFQTEEIQAYFPKRIRNRSRVIINPISDSFYGVTPPAEKEKRVVSCGRLQRQKRHDLLIDAFDRISDQFPDYRLEIYGNGVRKDELQDQINALDRQDRVFLKGGCENVPDTIKNASLFVLSSDYEGLPNALMEAMALGLPVISTDCGGGGARALIEDSVDGLIVPCGDVDALANAIRESLEDPEAAAARGRKAREKATNFCAEKIVTLWEDYIRQIADDIP